LCLCLDPRAFGLRTSGGDNAVRFCIGFGLYENEESDVEALIKTRSEED
jgi:hypothetical protein